MRQVAMLLGGQIEPIAIFLGNQIGLMLYYEAMGESVFFWTNTENCLLLTQIRIHSKFVISLSIMHTSPSL